MTTPEEILAAVHEATGVPASEILTDRRTAQVSTARFLAMRLYADSHPWAANHDAAKAVGKIDPGTGRHGLMRAAHLMEHDPAFREAHAMATGLLASPTSATI